MSSSLSKSQKPAVAIRGVHLDLKGLPPTFKRLLELLSVFAAAGYNAVLVEWEDMFPWVVDDRFRSRTAYSSEQVDHFHQKAKSLGLQIIPLVQSLGHMETFLSLPDYAHLRECPERPDVLNPLAKGARELVEKLVENIIQKTPELSYLHLGGDEAWTSGTHPDTKAFIKKHGKGALLLSHIEPILDKLNNRGIRPILWHDMCVDLDDSSLAHLSEKTDLMVWGYAETPDETKRHYNTGIIEQFHSHGIPLWAATAYKGADGCVADLPNLQNRYRNAVGWVDICKRFNLKGIIATGWSRYSTHRPQTEPIDAALDTLFYVGRVLHDGIAPKDGLGWCIQMLNQIGQGPIFLNAKEALRQLSEARKAAWKHLQVMCEQIALEKMNCRFCSSKLVSQDLRRMDGLTIPIEEAADKVREALAGLIDEVWIEEYLTARIDAVYQQIERLKPEVHCLEDICRSDQ